MTPAEQNTLPTGYRLLGQYEILEATSLGVASVKYTAVADDGRVVVEEYFPPRLAVRLDTGEVGADPRRAEEFEAGLAAFLATARLLAGVNRETVVAVRQWTDANGTGYLVTREVEGETLGGRLAPDGTLPPDEIESVFSVLVDGLEAAHAAGLLHRQISPDAILLRTDGVPVLRDFGVGTEVARSARQVFRQRHRSRANIVPGYAALEQYSDLGREGPWTDVYGLGAVLHRCVFGAAPDDAPFRQVRGDTAPAARFEASLPDRMRAAIDQALALRIAARPQSLPAWRGMLFETAYRSSSAVRAGRTSARGFGRASSVVAAPQRTQQPVHRGSRASADPEQPRRALRWVVPAAAATALTAFITYVDTGVLRGHDAADAAPAVPRGNDPSEPFTDEMRSGGSGPAMRVVEQGALRTGCAGADCPESAPPPRTVTVERPFALSAREVTFEEYDRFAAAEARALVQPAAWSGAHPVVNVSWDDAAAYAQWLSAETGQAYRLPTEAEWEYAAHAGAADPPGEPSEAPMPSPNPAGAGAANPWGFHDMAGNVSEWVADCVATAGADSAARDPACLRVRRGGSWIHGSNADVAVRDVGPATRRALDTGFRVARAVDS
ncbi:MAG: SUMF1/EgtB/PvdO family nonheme iron enzyme [Gammaproteobacteria bacterium]|nr:SUMF1/EgtB/PvdO family nonheme iron enzyme [Gammaproteobacteria bacterium]